MCQIDKVAKMFPNCIEKDKKDGETGRVRYSHLSRQKPEDVMFIDLSSSD